MCGPVTWPGRLLIGWWCVGASCGGGLMRVWLLEGVCHIVWVVALVWWCVCVCVLVSV